MLEEESIIEWQCVNNSIMFRKKEIVKKFTCFSAQELLWGCENLLDLLHVHL